MRSGQRRLVSGCILSPVGGTVKEMERVGRKHRHIVVESFRNEEEQVNLMYWVLTGRCFFSPEEWEWFYRLAGYTGDHSFIYFE